MAALNDRKKDQTEHAALGPALQKAKEGLGIIKRGEVRAYDSINLPTMRHANMLSHAQAEIAAMETRFAELTAMLTAPLPQARVLYWT